MIVRDKDRDIKRLKNEAEDLRDLIISKEQKISEMEVEKAKLQASPLQKGASSENKSTAKQPDSKLLRVVTVNVTSAGWR